MIENMDEQIEQSAYTNTHTTHWTDIVASWNIHNGLYCCNGLALFSVINTLVFDFTHLIGML